MDFDEKVISRDGWMREMEERRRQRVGEGSICSKRKEGRLIWNGPIPDWASIRRGKKRTRENDCIASVIRECLIGQVRMEQSGVR